MALSVLSWIILAVVAVSLVERARTVFRKGIKNVPGPALARISGLYRLSIVAKGNSPQNYRKLHDQYGKLVRVGPNHVSVADSSEIPQIYGIGSKFLKTPFYSTMTPIYRGKSLESLFSTRDPVYHKALKVPVAQLFSMSNMRNFEPYADECTNIFIAAMQDLEGQDVDLGMWLQWYAFDVIACITFQRRFGFMEERRDVGGMIGAIDGGLQYVKVVGQYPGLHAWLLGNRRLMALVKQLFPNIPDPLKDFLDITEQEITRYDQAEKGTTGRTDFLAQLRMKEAKDGKLTNRDIQNHLSNNILAGSDTTAISLRACFYFLIKNPPTYDRLVDEILKADEEGQLSKSITYEECLKLPYLQAVMKEAMRLHPGVGFPLERFVPPGGATICGENLPAGTVISMSAPVLHMSKDVWGDDAEAFKPERWLDSDPETRRIMDRNFLAFGHGARTCIGKNISIMEMGKLIPQILRQFDLEWASPDPEWKLNAAWFWKQSNLITRFKSRGVKAAKGEEHIEPPS